MDCKALIYNSQRQEAITPIYPNQLVKWDVSQQPRVIQQLELPYQFLPIPSIALLPGGDRFAVTPFDVSKEHRTEIRRWDDWAVLERIALPPKPEEIVSLDEQSQGYLRYVKVCSLMVTPCQRYLIIMEASDDIHLLDLETNELIRWSCRWFDYTDKIAVDFQRQFVAIISVDMDEYYYLFRIENLVKDELTSLGQFNGGIRCHKGQIRFSPDGERLVYTACSITQKIELISCRVERLVLARQDREKNPPIQQEWVIDWPIQHKHDALNPWQSDIAWLDSQTLACAVNQSIVLVRASDGHIEATYPTDATVNAIALDMTSRQIVAATKQGIQKIELPR